MVTLGSESTLGGGGEGEDLPFLAASNFAVCGSGLSGDNNNN